MNIKFIKAYRAQEHIVKAVYKLDEIEFTIEWCCMNNDGEIDQNNYFLQDGSHDVTCEDSNMADKVLEAIRAGDSDDNPDLELYLFIRDTFNSNDCEEI